MYDYSMLSKIMEQTGFQDIRRCEYRNSKIQDVEQLDNNPNQSLYVEAQK
jgi:hypothetical protein